jgi:hypothetical protein
MSSVRIMIRSACLPGVSEPIRSSRPAQRAPRGSCVNSDASRPQAVIRFSCATSAPPVKAAKPEAKAHGGAVIEWRVVIGVRIAVRRPVIVRRWWGRRPIRIWIGWRRPATCSTHAGIIGSRIALFGLTRRGTRVISSSRSAITGLGGGLLATTDVLVGPIAGGLRWRRWRGRGGLRVGHCCRAS